MSLLITLEILDCYYPINFPFVAHRLSLSLESLSLQSLSLDRNQLHREDVSILVLKHLLQFPGWRLQRNAG